MRRVLNLACRLVLALFAAGLVLYFSGYSPLAAYKAMIWGAVSSWDGIAQTLVQATPLIFTGLAVALANNCGVFNIGAEGQLYLGAMAAAVLAAYLPPLPHLLHVIIALCGGALFGGLWALIAAWLKIKADANEVIITIMLNSIGTLLCAYLANYTFKAPGPVPQTPTIHSSAALSRLGQGAQFSSALFVGLFFVLVVWFLLYHTKLGYDLKVVGSNPRAAAAAGINVPQMIGLTLLLSGALAGLGGAGQILGLHGRYIDGFSPGYGFDGVAVAILGGNSPLGVLFSALLFGLMRAGGMILDRTTNVPVDFVIIIQAAIILFVSAPELLKTLKINWKKGGVKHARTVADK
ncbi:MAG: ABC transporter permease [Firmicutes bacterium]|nr:ABC transporter permease [Bacillota bacterium]MDD4264444.1 ABC transporter permease [Bacillota bacterium]MDD4692830.1 ABC transporter permease [Bacillota bacterium]